MVRTEFTTQAIDSPPDSPDAIWKGYTDGTRFDWYASGVGLAKVEYRHANGRETHVELVDLHLKRKDDSIFPRSVGSAWQYEWRDENGALLFREFWRVAAREKEAAYLGLGAYEYK